ncbi:GatB/YqeY domain-containing protein [Anaerolineales bacterium HSG6]|nr:GatB/YqeY domain-containing protein [Anaerolineales bacterium HSG6]MDM8531576.1 GatB/YqeY domain-containing protein [Anaerolineales bacterium HSG25]
MSLLEQINQDLKIAMKEKDKNRTGTIRMLKSALKYAEIEAKNSLDDDAVLVVISKQVKQRRDSIEQFEKAGRIDLVEKEAEELAVLETYLPTQLSPAEIEERAKAVISDLGVTNMKGMGQVMKQLTSELKGQADGKTVSQVVRQLLS